MQLPELRLRVGAEDIHMADAGAAVRAAEQSWCADGWANRSSFARINRNWRDLLDDVYPALLREGLALPGDSHDAYQFGVWTGWSVERLRRSPFRATVIHAFDSFTGLPAELAGGDRISGWAPGSFAVGSTSSRGVEAVRAQLRLHGVEGVDKIHFYPGLYSESLSETLASSAGMRPAAYIDVDCDLYVSTAAALRWMLRSRLIVPGTLIGYDDWWVHPCAADSTSRDSLMGGSETLGQRASTLQGEWRAHVELAREFNLSFRCVAGACRLPPRGFDHCGLFNHVAPIFLVRSIGPGSVADDGVRLPPSAMRAYLQDWRVCQQIRGKHRVVREGDRQGASLVNVLGRRWG